MKNQIFLISFIFLFFWSCSKNEGLKKDTSVIISGNENSSSTFKTIVLDSSVSVIIHSISNSTYTSVMNKRWDSITSKL